MKVFSAGATVFLCSFLTPFLMEAQTDIQQQYEAMIAESTVWEDYKVIKHSKLTDFGLALGDTLLQKQRSITDGLAKVDNLNTQVTALKAEVTQTRKALEESNRLNDSIGFFGMQFSKTGYSLVVWMIIVMLVTGMGAVFVLFKRNHIVTRQSKKELSNLETEYSAFREKARETQIKLKRELQTALNTLNEQHNSQY